MFIQCFCGGRIDNTKVNIEHVFCNPMMKVTNPVYGPRIPHDMARGVHEIYGDRGGLRIINENGVIEHV